MGRHSTDVYNLPKLSRAAAVSAAEVLNTDYDADDFVTLWYEDQRSPQEDGQYHPTLKQMPMGFPQGYDQIEFMFAFTATSMTACTLKIQTLMPNGDVLDLAQVVYANGAFPSTKIAGVTTPIYISVAAITGTSLDTLSVNARGIRDVTNAPLGYM